MENKITIPLKIKRRFTLIRNNWDDTDWGRSSSLIFSKEQYIRDMCGDLYYKYVYWEYDKISDSQEYIDVLILLFGEIFGEIWEERHNYMVQLLL